MKLKLENLSVEELACESRKINEILSAYDRAQPISGAEVAKLEWYLEGYYFEIIWRRERNE